MVAHKQKAIDDSAVEDDLRSKSTTWLAETNFETVPKAAICRTIRQIPGKMKRIILGSEGNDVASACTR